MYYLCEWVFGEDGGLKMLKILFNKKSNCNEKLILDLKGNSFSATVEESVENGNGDTFYGHDVIEKLVSYNSYSLIDDSVKVKIFREIKRSDFKFIDLNRLGIDVRLDFAKIIQLYGKSGIIQVDTGIISEQQKDIVVRVFQGKIENTVINSDLEYSVGEFNSDELVNGDHPRDSLWDSYALSVLGGEEWKADKKGVFVVNPESAVVNGGVEYIDFIIRKYKGRFERLLDRDIDDEEVFVDVSAGLANNRRVPLENGVGTFRLYLFGHKGPIKIKLGRRWYRVWNEYNLFISGE